ncbi:MAG: hypothetical protein L0H31_14625 [Nocardioidaceae bacterium]|nr:hypothetical protein [Nocardioidaceae bacterium]
MARRVTDPYCDAEDVMLGDIQVPRSASVEDYIRSAADEMDSWIGQVYKIPIQFDAMNPAHAADVLLLNKLNAHLATGRLLLMAAAGHADGHLQAYGKALIDDVQKELARITAGRTEIEAGELIKEDPNPLDMSPIQATNRDSTSLVGQFYGEDGTTAKRAREWFQELTDHGY